jgi:hypothetical protein
MRHKWADLIIDWAEGVGIQQNYVSNPDDSGWLDCEGTPLWHDNFLKFRRKPKEPSWYENIPEHGVLCWTCDVEENTTRYLDLITAFIGEYGYYKFRSKDGALWVFATPLTNEEIEAFKR